MRDKINLFCTFLLPFYDRKMSSSIKILKIFNESPFKLKNSLFSKHITVIKKKAVTSKLL